MEKDILVWLAVDMNGKEKMFKTSQKPYRESFQRNSLCPKTFWATDSVSDVYVFNVSDTIKQILGKELTWEDEPVQVKLEDIKKYTMN